MIHFGSVKSGAKIPNGSKIGLIRDRTPRLVPQYSQGSFDWYIV